MPRRFVMKEVAITYIKFKHFVSTQQIFIPFPVWRYGRSLRIRLARDFFTNGMSFELKSFHLV